MSFEIVISLVAVFSACFVFWPRKSAPSQKKEACRPEFALEVMHDGKAVAHISDPLETDLFWSTYLITPVNDEGRKLILTDELWDSCQFYFRDPKTRRECRTGFAGGKAPFIENSRISLRGLHF